TGTVAGSVSVQGTVKPGDSPGILTLGSADYSNGGTLLIQVPAYGTPGTSYDQLKVTGALTLGGTSILELDPTGLTTDGTATSIATFGSISGSPSATFNSITTTNNPLGFNVTPAYHAGSLDVSLDLPLTDTSTTATANSAEGASTGNLVVATFTDA